MEGSGSGHDAEGMDWTPAVAGRPVSGHHRRLRPRPGSLSTALIDDLAIRAAMSGAGPLLDPACGPGALSEYFGNVNAIGHEGESVSPSALVISAHALPSVRRSRTGVRHRNGAVRW